MHAREAVKRGGQHWIEPMIGDTDTVDNYDMQKAWLKSWSPYWCEAMKAEKFVVAPVFHAATRLWWAAKIVSASSDQVISSASSTALADGETGISEWSPLHNCQRVARDVDVMSVGNADPSQQLPNLAHECHSPGRAKPTVADIQGNTGLLRLLLARELWKAPICGFGIVSVSFLRRRPSPRPSPGRSRHEQRDLSC